MRSELIAETLSKVPILATLCPEDIRRLAVSSRQRDYRTGSPIVLQADINASMYVVVDGCVKVHRTTERGTDVVLAILGSNECFGELSFIDGLPRSAAVSALEDTKTIELTSAALQEAVLASPGLAWSLLKAVALRLRQQNSVVETLVTKDVSGRVAELLLRLSRHHGKPYTAIAAGAADKQLSSVVIALTLSQSDIGTFVGATRERVSRVMTGMRRNLIIDKEPGTGRILILNVAKLERMAEIA